MVPVLPAKSTTNNNNSFLDRLHRVEKHLRKNKLKLTLTERLGAAQEADDVSSQAEAKKLAFYLFWNCKSSFERYSTLVQCILPSCAAMVRQTFREWLSLRSMLPNFVLCCQCQQNLLLCQCLYFNRAETLCVVAVQQFCGDGGSTGVPTRRTGSGLPGCI